VRLASLVRKTALENLRDWKILIMTLSFAPFFTVLMHFYFVETVEQTLSAAEALSEFDLYVPGMLTLAVMMLIFPAAASFIKEKDRGTLVRLRMSNMTTIEWLLAVTLVQVFIGELAVLLTLLTAILVGYEPVVAIPSMVIVSGVSVVSLVGISILVAAWLRTVFDLMTIGCFPFFILMFFSGGMFPLPDIRLFEMAGRTVNVNDVLPTTHTISALNEILNHGAGLIDVAFELAAIVALTVVLLGTGTLLFTKRHMSANAA